MSGVLQGARGSSAGRRMLGVAAAACIFAALAGILYGEFATSVGTGGLVSHGAAAAGMLAFGAGMLLVLALLLPSAWAGRPRSGQDLLQVLKELARVAANVMCYAGAAVLALGALTALDRGMTPALVAAVAATWAACIAAVVLYHRFRKRHPATYCFLPVAACALSAAAFAAFAIALGGHLACQVAADAAEGPREAVCAVSGLEKDRPTGRYRALMATTFEIDFETASEGTVHLSVAEQDAGVLQDIADAGGIVRLAYYPRTQVYVACERAV